MADIRELAVERIIAERKALAVETAKLRQVIAAAVELHRAYDIYEPCNHDHTDDDVDSGAAQDVSDVGRVCADGHMYTICTFCCADRYPDGEVIGQTETCANGSHGHQHTTDGPICPTRAALDGGGS